MKDMTKHKNSSKKALEQIFESSQERKTFAEEIHLKYFVILKRKTHLQAAYQSKRSNDL
jgi:hypothetical protein